MTTPWQLLPHIPSEGLLSPEEWVGIGELFGFTGRELNVAILLFETKTRAGIARKLGKSAGSVRKRIDKVFRKMNVRDRVGLVHRVWHVHRKLFGPSA